MNLYRCFVPALKNAPGHAMEIVANSSLEARMAFAAAHTAMQFLDCIAVRIWDK